MKISHRPMSIEPTRKIDPRSKLRNLPPEKQEAIVKYAKKNSVEATAKWLAKSGIKTCRSGVSRFLAWHRLNERFTRNNSIVQIFLDNLKSSRKDITPERLEMAGQMFFAAIALDQEDPVGWKRIQDLRIRRDAIELNREKWEFEAVRICRAKLPDLKAIEDKPKWTEREKEEAIRAILFPRIPPFVPRPGLNDKHAGKTLALPAANQSQRD